MCRPKSQVGVFEGSLVLMVGSRWEDKSIFDLIETMRDKFADSLKSKLMF
jgi:hypothetical protein